MKFVYKILIISIIICSYSHAGFFSNSPDLKSLLKKIEEAESKKLPKTAIQHSIELEKKAKKLNAKGMYIRAITKRILNQAHIQGKKPKDKVKILRDKIKNENKEIRPILRTILAIWFWHYYNQNSYKFSSRSQTQDLQDDDFTSWDSPRLFSQIGFLFEEALKDEDFLKKHFIKEYKGVILPGSVGLKYCKTLYCFITREAISFYTLGVSTIPSPEDSFEIDSKSKAFSSINTFLAYKPVTTDKESYKLKAVKLYQKLLKFYWDNDQIDPLIDTNIQRLKYVKQFGVGSDKDDQFAERMEEIREKYQTFETSTLASYELARLYQQKKKYVKAINVCDSVSKQFYHSDGAKYCRNLQKEILRKAFEVSLEYSINESNSKLFVKYKNVNKLHFKVIKDDWEKYIQKKWGSLRDYLSKEDVEELLTKDSVQQWEKQLKPTIDYKYKNISVKIPKLPYGFYRIFVSERDDFRDVEGNQVSYTSFWITDSTILIKNANKYLHGLLVDSRSGEPLNKQEIRIYKKGKKGKYAYFNSVNTNNEGTFRFENAKGFKKGNYYLHAKSKTGDIVYHNPFSPRYIRPKKIKKSIVFFTDRAIYRPGQKIHFKGVCVESDHIRDRYKVDRCKNVKVALRDANYQEKLFKTVSANQFGSFGGTFTIPKSGMTGRMTIMSHSPSGTVSFNVEEYKRPKFEVDIDKLTKEYRVNEEVEIKGKAITYTGVPIVDAKVMYRVVRELRLPWWWRWINPFQKSREIAHGTVKSNRNGKFKILFKAIPDREVKKEIKAFFTYKVEIDVIDKTGEKISASQNVNVGYISLNAKMDTRSWLPSNEDVKIKILTTNLDNKPIDNYGHVAIFKLDGPKKPERKHSLPKFYNFYYSEKQKSSDKINLSEIKNWKQGEFLSSLSYQSKNGEGDVSIKLKPGAYRAILKTKDSFGSKIEEKINFIVFSKKSSKFKIKVPSYFALDKEKVKVGDKLRAIWASGYKNARAYVSIIHNEKIIKSYWTNKKRGSNLIDIKVTKKLIGGFTLNVNFVRENQVYSYNRYIGVERRDKKLSLSFKTFRSKLRPGQKEKWVLKIKGKNAKKIAAEVVATMFDASLETFLPYNMSKFDSLFWKDRIGQKYLNNIFLKYLNNWISKYYYKTETVNRSYPHFSHDITKSFSYIVPWPVFGYARGGKPMGNFAVMTESEGMAQAPKVLMSKSAPQEGELLRDEHKADKKAQPSKKKIMVRKNLNETAFFLPHLKSNRKGEVEITFEAPEALTKWKLFAMAHGKKLESGKISKEAITQKELMVQPLSPRFLRQGDELFFTAKVSNVLNKKQKGTIYLELENALNNRKVNKAFIKTKLKKKFVLKSKESKVFSWKISVPNVNYPIIYRVVAQSKKFADGEEGFLSILSRKIFVQESIPLWISNKGTKKINFKKLANSSKSKTIKHEKLVLQMASNPAWYAVQALPYVSNSTHENNDQTFNRLYANLLGKKILESNSRIETIFKQWRKNNNLKSNLQKNEELKRVLLNETPWVLDAKNETEAKNNISLFFESNTLNSNIDDAYSKLKKNMLHDGGWPWFSGGRRSDYITLYIVTGFGKLKKLGVKVDTTLANKSVESLDKWIKKIYEKIEDKHKDKNNYSNVIALYLYGRSFYLKDNPIKQDYIEAVEYFISQAKKYWTKLDSRMGEAHTALGTWRFGKEKISKEIIKSLRERALYDDEMGMYWGDEEYSYWWYRAPIETHSLMIELFSELGKNEQEVEKLKYWLLKQKQTQAWKTRKATTNAIYSLLMKGDNILKSSKLVQTSLGKIKIKPKKSEAGTGFYEKRFVGKEIKPSMGKVTLRKLDKGISWGGLFWQYFEDIEKITPHKTPLKIEKKLFVKRNTKKGPVIIPIEDEKIKVGDNLVIRIKLEVDRDMEFVFMKDMRGSGTEPVNVISRYKYQDGLACYESTKDIASYFYIDYLPKGNYVFEYELKIYHKGTYQMGMAEIQCMYAPEFSAHSKTYKISISD